MTVSPANAVYQALSVDGDGTGSTDGAVDGSVTPVVLKLLPPAGRQVAVERLIVSYSDAGSFDSAKYGNGITVANGVLVAVHRVVDDAVVLELGNVRTNADWGGLCYDIALVDFGTGNAYLNVRWTLSKDTGGPLLIGADQYLAITIRDNLSNLASQRFEARGALL